MRRHPSAETRPVLVILPGNESFHLVKIRLLHSRKFADLHDPVTLQLLSRRLVVHIRKVQAVGIPLAAKLRDQRTFAYPLISIQNNHGIKLHSRLMHTDISGAQFLPRDRPDIRGIICSQIIDQKGINPLYAIPFRKGSEKLPYRMV